jgi:hypothetical protein
MQQKILKMVPKEGEKKKRTNEREIPVGGGGSQRARLEVVMIEGTYGI